MPTTPESIHASAASNVALRVPSAVASSPSPPLVQVEDPPHTAVRAEDVAHEPSSLAPQKKKTPWTRLLVAGVFVIAALAGGWGWLEHRAPALPAGIVSANGRLEATQVDIASKFAGRVAEVLVREGDHVAVDQVVARMDTLSLKAQLAEMEAQIVNAKSSKVTALASVRDRQSSVATAVAQVGAHQSDLSLVEQQFDRSSRLLDTGSIAQEQLDVDRSKLESAKALLVAAKSQVDEARAAVDVAKTQVDEAEAQVDVAMATADRVKTDIADAELRAPRTGRIQHRLAQAGEVVAVGGKILVLVDLTDVYMTVFLPETASGRLAVGGEARLVLDAASQHVIPAKVSYVASEAQFTPKTVETQTEREKLEFEVRLQLDPARLAKYEAVVKVGVPGLAYVRVDPAVPWPANLNVNLPPPLLAAP